VPLGPGGNILTATATGLAGPEMTVGVTVTSVGIPPVLELSADRTGGVVPFAVTFQYSFHSTTKIQSLSIDFDGDGTADLSSDDPSLSLSHAYDAPGLYLPHLRVTDVQGATYDADVPLAVESVATMDALFKSLWTGMNNALVTGDLGGALAFLDPPARARYRPVFEVLGNRMPGLVASYEPIQGVTIRDDVAEYAVNRTIDDERYLFLVYFLRGVDGVWRLDSM